MTDLDLVRYEAFFDEMSRMEKQAMLEKTAGVGSMLRAGKQLFRNPKAFGRSISKGWGRGMRQAGPDAGLLDKGKEGLKAVWNTPQGRLALGGAGAAGLMGTGYLAGRSGNNQNVYVR